MEYKNVQYLRWANAGRTLINCDVVFLNVSVDPIPFTASPDDIESHGAEIFQRASNGDFGEIAEYADYSPSAEQLLTAWRQTATCGPLELRRALRTLGLYDTIAEYMTTADIEIQEAWEYATVVKRLDPFVLSLQLIMNKTDTEVDALFELALTLG